MPSQYPIDVVDSECAGILPDTPEAREESAGGYGNYEQKLSREQLFALLTGSMLYLGVAREYTIFVSREEPFGLEDARLLNDALKKALLTGSRQRSEEV